MTKKASGKNGLVELFRFICSVWVAYYHGFFPVLSNKFDGVNISIDFFFMVCGLFFLKSMERFKEKPFLEGVRHLTWGKTKGFIVPLGFAALSILSCNIIFEMEFDRFNWPFSFLWFFGAQFVLLSLYLLLFKKVKKRSTLNIICVTITCVTMCFCLLNNETAGRVIRGPGMIALGILVSQIPKIRINLKNEVMSNRASIALNVVGFIVSALAFFQFAYLPGYNIGKLHIFICIICPSLLYFATAIPLKGKLFDLFGELSVFIYLAQCPILLHFYSGTRVTTDYFGWLCFYALAMFVVNRIVNAIIIKRRKALA